MLLLQLPLVLLLLVLLLVLLLPVILLVRFLLVLLPPPQLVLLLLLLLVLLLLFMLQLLLLLLLLLKKLLHLVLLPLGHFLPRPVSFVVLEQVAWWWRLEVFGVVDAIRGEVFVRCRQLALPVLAGR